MNSDTISKYFRVLSNPTRMSIFLNILDTSCESCMEKEEISDNCVTRIAISLGIPQPTVSNHVKELLDFGLVESKRKGKNIYLFPSSGFSESIDDFSKYISSKKHTKYLVSI